MKRIAPFIALLISLMLGWTVWAQSQPAGTYSLAWYTVDGGGGTSGAGDYSMQGTIGQPDAGQAGDLSYTNLGGFWGGTVAPYRTLLPMLLKNA